MGKLTAREVASLSKPGRYTDGDGLLLFIDSVGRKYWQLRYTFEGKRRDLSIGPERHLSLRDAREVAAKARLQIREGADPIASRQRAEKGELTFAQAAERVHAAHKAKWRNGKHQDQWLASLKNHAFDAIGDKRVADVTQSDVIDVLSPIWLTLPETARRVKQRIEVIIDWADGDGIRNNAIDFRKVAKALPRQKRRVRHMAALHYTDVPEFMKALALSPATPLVRIAVEFMILTASRSAGIRFMTWDEVDLEAGTWRIPAEKMKMERDHYVPLPPRAVELLNIAKRFQQDGSERVFPGEKQGKPMSENTKCNAIRDLGFDSTAHGFRTSFKDWSRAAFWPDYLSEFQLSHVDDNKSRAPYGRDGQLALRRTMMEEWAEYIAGLRAAPENEGVPDTDLYRSRKADAQTVRLSTSGSRLRVVQ